MKHRLGILLAPGIGLKRWLALFVFGLGLFGLGVAFVIAVPISSKMLPVLRSVTLSGFPPLVRGVVFILLGSGLGGFALYRFYRVFISGIQLGNGRVDILTTLDQRRRLQHGLRIVAIGGGTGLTAVLRGLRHETSNLTAIVTISDDGGSSGRLRDDLDIPPMGDARSCLVALSQAEPQLEELFRYRFTGESYLEGHSLGNLLLAALYKLNGGISESLEAAARLLSLSGRVLPVATDSHIVLMGETTSGEVLKGESAVGHAPSRLQRVWITPVETSASEAALEAIRNAELIVIGPGSLYTSIIPNFLIGGISEAVEDSSAPKVFICNVATQPGETDGYGVRDHLEAFKAHAGINVTHLLFNNKVESLPEQRGLTPVGPDYQFDELGCIVIQADVIDKTHPTRHDPRKLARVLTAVRRGSKRASTA